jgi:hypothetical protein
MSLAAATPLLLSESLPHSTTHGVSCDTVSHATRSPTRHVSPRDTVAHAIRYPFQWTRSTALPAMRPATPSARRPPRPCRLLRAPPPSKAVRAPIGLCTPTCLPAAVCRATRLLGSTKGCPRCSLCCPCKPTEYPHVYRAALCTHHRLEHTVYAPSAEPCCADFSYQNFACSTSQPTPSPRSYDWATSTIACVPTGAERHGTAYCTGTERHRLQGGCSLEQSHGISCMVHVAFTPQHGHGRRP